MSLPRVLAWPGLVVEENNLPVQIGNLRRVLGPMSIATIPGRGYRFDAEVENDGAGDEDRIETAGGPLPATELPPIAVRTSGSGAKQDTGHRSRTGDRTQRCRRIGRDAERVQRAACRNVRCDRAEGRALGAQFSMVAERRAGVREVRGVTPCPTPAFVHDPFNAAENRKLFGKLALTAFPRTSLHLKSRPASR
jgi:hypothetical protein